MCHKNGTKIIQLTTYCTAFPAVKEKTDLGEETNIILDFLIRFWTVSAINQIKNKRESGVTLLRTH